MQRPWGGSGTGMSEEEDGSQGAWSGPVGGNKVRGDKDQWSSLVFPLSETGGLKQQGTSDLRAARSPDDDGDSR